ncbi:MAG: class I SAM-dependent methyltransferase [Ilumatobacter sp.]|nr:class I SAM-dependent methyltransferase [Ilumatobacter sp.]
MTGDRDRAPSRWAAERSLDAGATYDEKWRQLAAEGRSIHGEADFVCSFEPTSVLDAGCGTGRVAIELDRRRIDVVGVDLDPQMLTEARRKAPDLTWVDGDLSTVDLRRTFDVVVAAGNVMIFVQPGSEPAVVANLARHVEPVAGVLVAGFQLGGAYGLDAYDDDCRSAGLELVERHATWHGEPFQAAGRAADYAVSVHRRAGPGT